MTSEEPGQDTRWESKERARRYLDEIRAGIPHGDDQLNVMIRVLKELGRPIERFLDLGAGGGALSAPMLEAFPTSQAVLVDFNEVMLNEAGYRFSAPPHHIVRADFSSTGWVDHVAQLAPFDAIVSGYAIHHEPDDRKRHIYAEIHDLLAPGGMFVNIEHVKPTTDELADVYTEIYFDWLARYHSRSETGKTRDDLVQDFEGRKGHGRNVLALLDDQLAWLREIGFEQVDCYFRILEMAVFGGRKATG